MLKFLHLVVSFSLLMPVCAQAEMTSTNFYIYADSIGLNGGDIATSTSYSINDTAADTPGGLASSASYTIFGGYQGTEISESLTITLGSTSLDLGTLSAGAVNEATTNVTVTSNSINGYTLSIGDVVGTGLTAVSDGAVTAGAEEYGVAVTGGHAAFADDRSVIVGRILASSNFQVIGAVTSVFFRASKGSGTAAGAYSQTLTVTVSANF